MVKNFLVNSASLIADKYITDVRSNFNIEDNTLILKIALFTVNKVKQGQPLLEMSVNDKYDLYDMVEAFLDENPLPEKTSNNRFELYEMVEAILKAKLLKAQTL